MFFCRRCTQGVSPRFDVRLGPPSSSKLTKVGQSMGNTKPKGLTQGNLSTSSASRASATSEALRSRAHVPGRNNSCSREPEIEDCAAATQPATCPPPADPDASCRAGVSLSSSSSSSTPSPPPPPPFLFFALPPFFLFAVAAEEEEEAEAAAAAALLGKTAGPLSGSSSSSAAAAPDQREACARSPRSRATGACLAARPAFAA
mmetsp:Transcript_65141/g.175182  ORF Transcript_65141/g.175182 Transcript_65141/m.175182 type:complete len:203 (-) Transcript_65141:594-1202(-)